MNWLSIFCIAMGIFILVSRAPLIFAPSASLRLGSRLILATPVRLRLFGIFVPLPIGLALLTLPFGEGSLAHWLDGFGWLLMLVWAVLMSFPAFVQRRGQAIFDFIENSVDDAVLRLLGVFGVAVGAVLIYVGIYVV